MTAAKIKASKAAAFTKIKELLSAEDIEGQFAGRSGNYHSSEKFIVTWNANYKLMLCEFGIDKVDYMYEAISGYKAIFAVRNLFMEKQLKGFHSIERALLEIGLKLCPPKERKEFFDKFCVPHNERIKANQKCPT